MSSNLSTDPSRPQLRDAVREWGVPAIKVVFLLLVVSGVASAMRSCSSTKEAAATAAVLNPRENPSVTCNFASGREKRYCNLPRGECSRAITFDPTEGTTNNGKVLAYGPSEEGVVLHRWTDVYGGTNYQLCANGGHAVDAYYRLIPKPD